MRFGAGDGTQGLMPSMTSPIGFDIELSTARISQSITRMLTPSTIKNYHNYKSATDVTIGYIELVSDIT